MHHGWALASLALLAGNPNDPPPHVVTQPARVVAPRIDVTVAPPPVVLSNLDDNDASFVGPPRPPRRQRRKARPHFLASPYYGGYDSFTPNTPDHELWAQQHAAPLRSPTGELALGGRGRGGGASPDVQLPSSP